MCSDSITGVVFIALAVFIYSVNWQPSFPPTLGDPGSILFPSVIAVAMGVLGAMLLVQSLAKARALRSTTQLQGNRKKPSAREMNLIVTGVLTSAALLTYVLSLPYIGYMASTAMFFFSASLALGERSPGAGLRYSAVALGVALATYYALTLGLNISLPRGSVIETLGQSNA